MLEGGSQRATFLVLLSKNSKVLISALGIQRAMALWTVKSGQSFAEETARRSWSSVTLQCIMHVAAGQKACFQNFLFIGLLSRDSSLSQLQHVL